MRSLLYVPGDRPEMLANARRRGADAVVVDLEDAVPYAEKDAARANVQQYLADPGDGDGMIMVRVNNSADVGLDLEASLSTKISALVLAKAESVETLEEIDRVVAVFETSNRIERGTINVVCLIETAVGVRHAFDLASHHRCSALGLGEADLAAELALSTDGADEAWAAIRSRIVIDSAAAGTAPPIGPVATDFTDLESLETSTLALARSGFGSRQAIHPAQVPVINRAFTPSAAEIEAARKLISRYEEAVTSGSGVITDEAGRMVDLAIIRQAQRVTQLADRLDL